MSDFSITFGFHPITIVLGLVIAAGLTWWVYRKTTPEIASRKRMLLAGLRWIGLALVIILLADPVIRSVLSRTQRPVIALLLDSSRSLSPIVAKTEVIKDRIDQLTGELQSSLDADVRAFTFSTDVSPLDVETDSIDFDGARTDISKALVEVESDLRGDPLAGVVLVSDGLFNTGRNPIYVAESYRVPIHTVVVGDTTAQRDVLIQRVAANHVAYVNRELPVRVSVRSDGFADRDVSVTIARDGNVVAQESVKLPEGRGEVPVDLSFTPTKEGFDTYSVEVSPLDGELTASNNAANFSVRVLSRKLQVLLLAGAPSPDVATLTEILELDSDIEVTQVTQKSRGEYYGESFPNDLSTFDAIILNGFPGKFTDAATVKRVADAGVPMLFVLDRGTNLRLVREDLGGAIPAVLQTVRPGFVEASAVTTPEGRTHPALDMDVSPSDLVRLPPLSYSQSLWEPTPDARTLATVAVRGIELEDPLLIVRERAGLRTAALLGAGIWRWKNVPEDLEDIEQLSPELISNLLRWMTAEEDDRPVRVEPTEDFFDGGDAVRLSGQVYDESLNPVDGASVLVTVTDPNGNEFNYTMDPIGNGRYSKDLGQLDAGSYRYAAAAEQGGAAIGADSGYFAVGELALEFRDTRSDAALMREVALRSGGQFSGDGDVTGFARRIAELDRPESRRVDEVSELPLRRVVALLLVIVALFSAEWAIRKRAGLV